jgi:hypothetical protein
VFVYGPDGELVKRFDNDNAATEADEFETADVDDLIGQILAEKKQ